LEDFSDVLGSWSSVTDFLSSSNSSSSQEQVNAVSWAFTPGSLIEFASPAPAPGTASAGSAAFIDTTSGLALVPVD
jgi:hypothetical protein